MSELGQMRLESATPLEVAYEALCRPAQITKFAIEFMATHPSCSKDELAQAVGSESKPANLSEISILVNELIKRREIVANVHQALAEDAPKLKMTPGQYLYRLITDPSGQEPAGQVDISNPAEPFAVYLMTRKEDFGRLDSRDVAGHYARLKHIKFGSRHPITVPFIALRSDLMANDLQSATTHETWHAFVDIVNSTLWKSQKIALWGSHHIRLRFMRSEWSSQLTKNWTRLKYPTADKDVEKLKATSPWKNILGYTFAWSKDELITRLANQEPTTWLTERNGLYDYVSREFTALPPDLANLLWEEHKKIILRETATIDKILTTYRNLGFSQKADLLPWILMRIPLGQWTESLVNAGVLEEVKWMDKLINLKNGQIGSGLSNMQMQLKPLLRTSDRLLTIDLQNLHLPVTHPYPPPGWDSLTPKENA